MPPCNKELNIKDTRGAVCWITTYCGLGEGHEGEHSWQVWTDDENPATGKKGIIKKVYKV